MKIETLQTEWQDDYSKIIKSKLSKIHKCFKRVYGEDHQKMFAERFPMIAESIARELNADVNIHEDTCLFNFLESYQGPIFDDAEIPREVAEVCPLCRGSKTLNEAIQKHESHCGKTVSKSDFLFELWESLEECQETEDIRSARAWVDKWFDYFNRI